MDVAGARQRYHGLNFVALAKKAMAQFAAVTALCVLLTLASIQVQGIFDNELFYSLINCVKIRCRQHPYSEILPCDVQLKA